MVYVAKCEKKCVNLFRYRSGKYLPKMSGLEESKPFFYYIILLTTNEFKSSHIFNFYLGVDR
jgi:hypothetical protein